VRSTAAAAALALALVGCAAKEPATVGATPLVQADGGFDPPAGATLEVTTATIAGITMPAEAVVRLAVARDVPWGQLEELIASIKGSGKRPILLVGQRWRTKAIELEDPIAERHTTVLAFVTGKACVRGPGVDAAKCVQSDGGAIYVEKAYVRQLVREAREAFGVDDVAVEVQGGLPWGDVVNALDGARTCCGEGAPIKVAVRTMVDDGTVLVPVEGD
jgi:hypothetical protein